MPPGPAKKRFRARLTGDFAAVENVAERHINRRRGGGEITVAQRMDLALLEPRGRRAKNKIHMALDVAILEILPAAVDENRVLPAEEPAIAERRAVAVHADGERLTDWPGRIRECDVLRREIIRINRRRRCLEGADGFAFRVRDAREEIVRQNGVRRALADELEVTFLALNVDEFLVSAGRNVDDHGGFPRAHRHGHDGRLHGRERRRTVGGDVKICLRKSGRNGQQQRGDE